MEFKTVTTEIDHELEAAVLDFMLVDSHFGSTYSDANDEMLYVLGYSYRSGDMPAYVTYRLFNSYCTAYTTVSPSEFLRVISG